MTTLKFTLLLNSILAIFTTLLLLLLKHLNLNLNPKVATTILTTYASLLTTYTSLPLFTRITTTFTLAFFLLIPLRTALGLEHDPDTPHPFYVEDVGRDDAWIEGFSDRDNGEEENSDRDVWIYEADELDVLDFE